MFFEKIPMI